MQSLAIVDRGGLADESPFRHWGADIRELRKAAAFFNAIEAVFSRMRRVRRALPHRSLRVEQGPEGGYIALLKSLGPPRCHACITHCSPTFSFMCIVIYGTAMTCGSGLPHIQPQAGQVTPGATGRHQPS